MQRGDHEDRALLTLDLYLTHSVWLAGDGRATLVDEAASRLVEGGAFEWMEVELRRLGPTIAAYDAQEGLSSRFAVRLRDDLVATVYASALVPWCLVSLFHWVAGDPDENRQFLSVQTVSEHVSHAAQLVLLLSGWGFYLASEAQCKRPTGLPSGNGDDELTYYELLFEFGGFSEPPWAWRRA